ncbi:MAG: hypothetical protein OEQ39_23980 [Gammaproteobacteria bacterium]|nr:hypothetical protein [Gammaproteobacteria bacterium]
MGLNNSIERSLKIVAEDRRLTNRLMGIWNAVRAGGESCPRADLFLDNLSSDLLESCCFAERTGDGEWELYQIGATIGRCSGVSSDTCKVVDLPAGSLLAVAVKDLRTAFMSRSVILDQGEVQDQYGRKTLFRSVLLPLADASGQVIRFVAGARCRTCIHDV